MMKWKVTVRSERGPGGSVISPPITLNLEVEAPNAAAAVSLALQRATAEGVPNPRVAGITNADAIVVTDASPPPPPAEISPETSLQPGPVEVVGDGIPPLDITRP